MKTFTKGIEAVTAKAYKIVLEVMWNDNVHTRSFWFPKSVVNVMADDNHGNPTIEVADWFARKMSAQNAFNGYYMQFAAEFPTEELV